MLEVENIDVDVVESVEIAQLTSIVESNNAVAKIRDALGGSGSPVCLSCGDVIPTARRKAYPSTIRCIDCQTLHEKK